MHVNKVSLTLEAKKHRCYMASIQSFHQYYTRKHLDTLTHKCTLVFSKHSKTHRIVYIKHADLTQEVPITALYC